MNGTALWKAERPGIYDAKPAASTPTKASREPCKHPRVQIVSRDEDTEYVECKECGDVFESSELKDMEMEEGKPPEDEVS